MTIHEGHACPIDLSIIPSEMQHHIAELLEASMTSKFYVKLDDKSPTLYVYLIELNQDESYNLCHLFVYEKIGNEYHYQSLFLEQIQAFAQLASSTI
ncbi:hypothetical protein [Paenibacillus faecalis]|uniref:hypothetical protein n=1 Tax=Paenibacillus faecalis TaxID=2079532 RepID=UPI000D0F2076|nr:hypothetical protein [Paenibacillus faecalis]